MTSYVGSWALTQGCMLIKEALDQLSSPHSLGLDTLGSECLVLLCLCCCKQVLGIISLRGGEGCLSFELAGTLRCLFL